MKILVLAGSPKGKVSVTMQYIRWLEQNFPEHTWTIEQVAQPIARMEKDAAELERIRDEAQAADGILWAFPLYIGLVHSGLKRFIELISERGLANAFIGKQCAILATSIHFFDNTAIRYIQGISEDLGMTVSEVFSAHMDDLTRPDGTRQLGLFFRKWQGRVESGAVLPRRTAPLNYTPQVYTPGEKAPSRRAFTLGIVTQSGTNANLDRMVERLSACFEQVKLYDLNTMKISGGCTGCIRCGYNNTCLYEGKDDVIETYRLLNDCDAVVACGFTVDRYLSAHFKAFIDRRFFNTHMPILPGKPMGFVVAGPLQQLDSLQEIMEGVYGCTDTIPAGMVSDEAEDIDGALDALADSLAFLAETGYRPPMLFPALGGRKIFRDEIYGGLGGVFAADHSYYKRRGWYDFPQKRIGSRAGAFLMRSAMRIPAIRRYMQNSMKENMLLSYRKVLK